MVSIRQIDFTKISDIGFDIYLLIGQSNAQGWGNTLDANFDFTSDRIYQYPSSGTYLNKIIQAKEPLFHSEQMSNQIGFCMSFAREVLLVTPNYRKILVVPCAVAGTGFSDNRWNPGNDLYNFAVQQCNAAKALNSNNRLKAILWHQGEQDVEMTKTAYSAALDAMITSLRNALNADTVPFILGELVREWVGSTQARINILQAIQEAPTRLSNVKVASSLGLAGNSGDNVHFSADSQRILGQRYFDKYLDFLNGAVGSNTAFYV
ncbi:sialate O-acetylesterase [Scytonema sp. NUACC21]